MSPTSPPRLLPVLSRLSRNVSFFIVLTLPCHLLGNNYPDQRQAALAQTEEEEQAPSFLSQLPPVASPIDDLFELPPDEFNPANEPSLLTNPTLEADTEIPTVPTDNPVPDTPLYRLAYQVISSVVLLRAYDEFGLQAGQTAGFFVSDDGKIMTDAALITKVGLGKVAYVTLTDARGWMHTVEGIVSLNTKSGVLILQADYAGKSLVNTNAKTPATQEQRPLPIAIVSVDETRGLVLADGSLLASEGIRRDPWMTVNGKNSPGSVGSPVLDLDGNLIGMVGMQLRLKHWFSFARSVEADLAALPKAQKKPTLVSQFKMRRSASVLDDLRFTDGFRSLGEGAVRPAANNFESLVKDYPRSSELWTVLGFAYATLRKNDFALAAFRRAAALDPDKGLVWYGLAVTSLASGANYLKLDTTRESLEKHLAENGGNGVAWLLLTKQYLRAQEIEKAAEAHKQAASILGDDADVQYLGAQIASVKGDLTEARVAITRSLQLDPKKADYWFFSGLLSAREGNTREALEAYKSTVKLNAKHPSAWMNLSQAYLAMGNRNEARQALDRHLENTAPLQ